MTRAEIILWSRLRSKKVNGYKFRRQQPLFEYVVDFYCHELKLIIEVDGEIHYEKTRYDSKRDNILKINGYHILRFTNFEVETAVDLTINKIISYIFRDFVPLTGGPQGVNQMNINILNKDLSPHRGTAGGLLQVISSSNRHHPSWWRQSDPYPVQ